MTVLSAVLIWLLAIIFALPDAIFAHLEEMPIKNNQTLVFCAIYNLTHVETYTKYNVVLKSLVYYVVPLFIIGGFYVLMAKRLHASANEMPGELQGAQSIAQARARRHVAKMVLIFVFRKFFFY